MNMTAFVSLILLPVWVSAPSVGFASEPATLPRVEIEEVKVIGVKNAAVMPYDVVYERLKRLQDSKIDRVVLQTKINTKDANVKLADVRLALVNDALSVPVPIRADGAVTVPMRADMYNTNAELRSNQPKGALGVEVSLAFNVLIRGEMPYSEIEETVRQFQVAGKDVLGWFGYMLFFPSVTNIDIPITYPQPKSQTLTIMKDGRAIKTFTADSKGVLTFRLDPRWKEWQPTFVFSEVPPKL